MLKIAIVRINDDDGGQEILLEAPLADLLKEEMHKLTVLGLRKRAARKAHAALTATENRLREQTITLP